MKTIFTIAMFIASATFCHSQESTSTSTLSEQEQVQVAVQKICPVSGDELGSMGDPVKVKVGEQIAFLCCKSCQSKKIDSAHWKTIQSRIAKAQGTCPIMEKAVDSTMKFAMIDGQKIFVCCPPCIEKIESDPKPSLAKVTKSYTKFLTAERKNESDKLHALAQGICPVSGDKLGSNGGPIKVKVGKEEHAFLCCKGCVGKKLNLNHWKTIQSNLAKAQAVCPVMKHPVNATMKSTVVNGRKIFVCCPPCIEKIKADPIGFVEKLDMQIAKVSQLDKPHTTTK